MHTPKGELTSFARYILTQDFEPTYALFEKDDKEELYIQLLNNDFIANLCHEVSKRKLDEGYISRLVQYINTSLGAGVTAAAPCGVEIIGRFLGAPTILLRVEIWEKCVRDVA